MVEECVLDDRLGLGESHLDDRRDHRVILHQLRGDFDPISDPESFVRDGEPHRGFYSKGLFAVMQVIVGAVEVRPEKNTIAGDPFLGEFQVLWVKGIFT